MIQYQILSTNIIRIVWLAVRRITQFDLGVKGLIKPCILRTTQTCLYPYEFVLLRRLWRPGVLVGVLGGVVVVGLVSPVALCLVSLCGVLVNTSSFFPDSSFNGDIGGVVML